MRIRSAVVAAAVIACAGSMASAQQMVPPPQPPPVVAPGWTLVPSVGAASSWDNNVALTSPQRGELKDQVTTAFSSLSTQYRGRRGDFLLEYRGMYDFYRRYTEFNAPDHRVRLNAQRRFTRTVTVSPVDDPTIGKADLFVALGQTVSGNLFADNGAGIDTDIDSAPTIIAINGVALAGPTVTLPSGALLTISANGNFTYDRNTAFANGVGAIETFTYRPAASNAVTVTIQIGIG